MRLKHFKSIMVIDAFVNSEEILGCSPSGDYCWFNHFIINSSNVSLLIKGAMPASRPGSSSETCLINFSLYSGLRKGASALKCFASILSCSIRSTRAPNTSLLINGANCLTISCLSLTAAGQNVLERHNYVKIVTSVCSLFEPGDICFVPF